MDFLQNNLLTLIVFSPLLAALFIFLLPDDEKTLIRRLALVLSFVPLGLGILAWLSYNRLNPGMQFEI